MSLKQEVIEKLDCKSYFAGEVEKFKSNGSALASALCSFHNDTRPSLLLNTITGYCECKGCGWKGSIFDFYMKKNHVTFSVALKALAQVAGISNGNGSNGKAKAISRTVETYRYIDEAGKLLFEVLRKEPKNFIQRRPDGNGGWHWNLTGITPVLYNLPKLKDANEIFIVEGEKDADKLVALGFIATTNSTGAGQWRNSYNQCLQEKDVVILPDNDEPGQKHAIEIAQALHSTAKSIKIIDLPGLPEKGDVADFIATFKEPDDANESLCRLIDKAGEWKPENKPEEKTGIKVTAWQPANVSNWLTTTPPSRDYLFKNLLPRKIIAALCAEGGTGKTMMLILIIISAVTGKKLFRFLDPVKPLRVFAILGEDEEGEVHRRFTATLNNCNLNIDAQTLNENLKLFCGVSEPIMKLEHGNPRLTPRYDWFKKEITEFRPDLVILDPKAQFFGLEENNNDHCTQFVNVLKNLLPICDCTILFTHHVSKASEGNLNQHSSRGGSALVDACRWVGNLKRLNEKEAIKLSIDDPLHYIEFKITKNNYAPLLPQSIYLKFQECGGLIQVDPLQKHLKNLATAIGKIIVTENLECTADEIIKRKPGENIREQIKSEFDSNTKRKTFIDAISYGLHSKILKEITVGSDNHRGKLIVVPYHYE